MSDSTSYKAVVVCTFIKKTYADVKVYTCDSRAASRLFHTKYADHHIVLEHTVHEPENYKDEILNIIKKNGIDVFIPVNSAEMDIFVSHKEQFSSALSYWGDYSSFKTLNEKNKLRQLCQECGIKTPQSFDSVANIKKFPIVIKPTVASAARGVRYFANERKLKKYLRTNPNLDSIIIQEYIQGIGVGYSVFAVDGVIKVGHGHRRIAEYPISGGSSVYRESFSDSRMVDIAKTLLERTNWSGFAMFEFKLTEDNEFYLIEVNPRIWGSVNQGLQNGANYFSALLGEENVCAEKNINTYFSPFVYFSLLLYALKGKLSPSVKFLKNLSRNKSDINVFEDPRAWLGSMVRLI